MSYSEKDTIETVALGVGRGWKVITGVVSTVVVIAIGVTTFNELQAKPTESQVKTIVESAVGPVRAKATEVDVIKVEAAAERKRVDRLEQVLEYTMERDEWQYDVVSHIAARKRGKPPGKPPSLKAKETKLLGIGK